MSLRARVDKLEQGLVIGTGVNNQDFWGISFGRPTAFLLLVLIADLPWITPNRLTHVSNLLLAAGALAILLGTPAAYLAAAILLNLSLTFDCADGQLARYRGAGSEFGAYYDKASDYIGMILLFAVLGWVTTQETGEPYYLLFALIALSGVLATGYCKWVAMAALYRHDMVPAMPPGDGRKMPWWEYLGRVLLKIFRFAEPDVLFWVGLGLLLDRLDWVLWLLVCTQVPVGILGMVYRGMQVARIDRR